MDHGQFNRSPIQPQDRVNFYTDELADVNNNLMTRDSKSDKSFRQIQAETGNNKKWSNDQNDKNKILPQS